MSRARRVVLWAWLGLALLGPALAPRSFRAQDRAAALAPPGAVHWLGTDAYGRDVASRLLVACGLSSLLAVAMAAPALALGALAGLGGAFSGRAAVWTRSAGEVCRSLPWIFVLVAVRAALPLGASPATIALTLALLFTFAAWPAAAWALQGAARDLLQREFVQAARGLGASRWQILTRHLWPNLRGLLATYFALLLAAAVGAEASLELVGLGLPPPWPTWGNMLDPLKDVTLASRCWWLYAPLLVLVPLLLALSWPEHEPAAC
jgi:oligopeptide transport system permease protein